MKNMTHKPDAVEIRDNRQLMKERSREVCRVCSSPDVHVDHYGQPTIKCIGYLRDERNRATAELDALRREVEAGKEKQADFVRITLDAVTEFFSHPGIKELRESLDASATEKLLALEEAFAALEGESR